MQGQLRPSYYNLIVRHGPVHLLFNGVTSGLLRLPNDIAERLLPLFGPERSRDAGVGRSAWQAPLVSTDDVPADLQPLLPELQRGGFLIPADVDELAALKERYEYFRAHDPFFVTITTTMNCNLGCYYCYEEREDISLTRERCDSILSWIQTGASARNVPKIYIDWYGGEPMLNADAIGYFSDRLIAWCDERGIGYSASMLSNGTLWPDDVAAFVSRTRLRHVQITLDGQKHHHDKRRRYVDPAMSGESSFDRICATVDRLRGLLRIYLRINVDPASAEGVLGLVEMFAEKGWLADDSQIFPYLAMIGPMTNTCASLGQSDRVRRFRDEFETLNHQFQRELARYMDVRSIQHLQYYPMTLKLNCAAVGSNSVVFGPDGYMYKCGLDVGNRRLAHDHIDGESKPALTADLSPHPWMKYDPFSHPRCGECQYLPVCMGGCPKTQFEQNEFYLQQQSRYWEENFDTIIRTYYDSARA